MRTFALAAILIGCAAAPASAAVYCFDGAGRPLGSGFDRETPNHRQIALARRTGGYCRDYGRGVMLPQIENRQYYDEGYYYPRRYRYEHLYR